MYLVINKWVIAVKVSKFSCQYLRNHWTLDIGVLGYIGIVWPKEHSPEVWSVPPVTPCIVQEDQQTNPFRLFDTDNRVVPPINSPIRIFVTAADEQYQEGKVKVKVTLVQALRLCTGRTAQRGSRGIALPFHDYGTRRGEGSASRSGRSLPPGKTRYPLYRGLGGPQCRSGQERKISSPSGFDPRTVQPVAHSLYQLSYPAHNSTKTWSEKQEPHRAG